jgi:hypothetical protein
MDARAVPIPTTIDEIDGDWVVAALTAGGAAPDGSVTAVEREPITDAVGLMGEVTRPRLSWDGGEDAPGSVVVKLPSALPDNRALGQVLGLYETEHRFYEGLAGEVGVRTPHVWFTGAEPEAARYVLVLEDLGGHERHDQFDGAPIELAEAMIDALASMHARYWGLDRLSGHGWVPEGTGEALRPFADLVAGSWPAFDEAIAGFAADADREVVRRFVEGYDRLIELGVDHPRTLLHRDYRLDNALFDDGAPVVFDWAGAATGGAMYDLHYFLGGSLTREDRSTHWRRLVERYLAVLDDGGVRIEDDLLDEMHRVNALLCLTVPVMAGGDVMDTRDDKGDRLIQEGLHRLFEHLADLDALAVLD